MTSLARVFPRHNGPTTLFVNFDGFATAGVAPYQSANRAADMQQILFRTAQVFAPFDVQVRAVTGNGVYPTTNGNTTIFVGDYTYFGTGYGNGPGGVSFLQDGPGAQRGTFHRPNSDPYNIAFADPLYFNATSRRFENVSTQYIASTIAHEAGHTFGLSHVLSAPYQDVMSYNAANTAFVNRTLSITTLNSQGSIPYPQFSHYDGRFLHTETITRQNSYTYLQATLGSRFVGVDHANVADRTLVDPTYRDGVMPGIAAGSWRSSSLGVGDYDVFQYYQPPSGFSFAGRWVTLDVADADSARFVNPVLFVYDGSGRTLRGYDDDSGPGFNSRFTFYAAPGQTYRVVVGSFNGTSPGTYRISASYNGGSLNYPAALAATSISTSAAGQNGAPGQTASVASTAMPLRSLPALQTDLGGSLSAMQSPTARGDLHAPALWPKPAEVDLVFSQLNLDRFGPLELG
jgi:hypothetical protein